MDVDRHDVEAAAFAIDAEHRSDGSSCGAAADGDEVAVLMHGLDGPFQIRDKLTKTTDLSEEPFAGFVVTRIKAKHGRVDIVVANAGVAYESNTENHSDDEWRRVMSINLDGVFYTVRAFGNIMLDQGKGSVVAISSIAGVKAVRPELHAGYDVTKAGVAHFCKVVGVEWAERGVRVNAVGPGYTNTEMLQKVGIEQPEVMAQWIDDIPMSRLLEPAEIARAVAFLASDAASGITGQLLMADAGYSSA